jgi:hypothetical protein
MQNTDLTVHAIASQERVSANYVYRLLRLPTLAPDIITAIVNGKNPPQLTAKKLMRLANAGRLVTRDSMERSSSSSAGRHRPGLTVPSGSRISSKNRREGAGAPRTRTSAVSVLRKSALSGSRERPLLPPGCASHLYGMASSYADADWIGNVLGRLFHRQGAASRLRR